MDGKLNSVILARMQALSHNVRFFDDSAVERFDSRAELTALLYLYADELIKAALTCRVAKAQLQKARKQARRWQECADEMNWEDAKAFAAGMAAALTTAAPPAEPREK